ncbi:MAG: MBL fold metallo-hydrolase, partial [Gammaproteobacteria bacterium]
MKIAVVPVTPFQQNCAIAWCENTRRAAVIDPGGDLDALHSTLAEYELEVEKILLTHAHIDHAGAAAALRDALDVPIEGPHR